VNRKWSVNLWKHCCWKQAGLASADRPEQLVISLEPEAASIFVRRQHLHQLVRDDELQHLGLGRPRSPRPGRISVGHRTPSPTAEHLAVQSGLTLIRIRATSNCMCLGLKSGGDKARGVFIKWGPSPTPKSGGGPSPVPLNYVYGLSHCFSKRLKRSERSRKNALLDVFLFSKRFFFRFPIFASFHFCNQQKSISILFHAYKTATTFINNIPPSFPSSLSISYPCKFSYGVCGEM